MPNLVWDKTDVQNVPKDVKVLGCKNIRTFQQVSGEQGETSMVLTFVNAAGQSVPPLIIHKGQHVQETWQLKAPGNMKIAVTERGYITKSKFHEYILHFVKFLKANELADKTNLLIIDGHKNHLYNLPLDSVPFAQFKKILGI